MSLSFRNDVLATGRGGLLAQEVAGYLRCLIRRLCDLYDGRFFFFFFIFFF